MATSDSRFAASPQKTDPDAGRLLGVVFEAVVPVGVLEPDLEHGRAGNVSRSPPDARRTTRCPGVWPPVRWTSTPGATSYSFSNGRSWLSYSFKNRWPSAEAVREPRRHGDAGEIGTPAPELGLGGRQVDPQVRTLPIPHAVGQQPPNVVHVHVGKHHVGHGGKIVPAASSRWACPARGKFKSGSTPIPASMVWSGRRYAPQPRSAPTRARPAAGTCRPARPPGRPGRRCGPASRLAAIAPIADHQHVKLADPQRVARWNQLVGPVYRGVRCCPSSSL